jgi:hypothetical protein
MCSMELLAEVGGEHTAEWHCHHGHDHGVRAVGSGGSTR